MGNNNSDATTTNKFIRFNHYFTICIDNSCKSVSHKNQKGEKWGAGGHVGMSRSSQAE